MRTKQRYIKKNGDTIVRFMREARKRAVQYTECNIGSYDNYHGDAH